MKILIIDASVVAAAIFGEPYAAAARKLFLGEFERHSPDFITVEIANVVWKRYRREEIDAADARDVLSDVAGLPLRKTPAADLVDPAMEIALRTDRSVYDGIYLALALRLQGVLITADQRLVNALAVSPLKQHVAWLGGF